MDDDKFPLDLLGETTSNSVCENVQQIYIFKFTDLCI